MTPNNKKLHAQVISTLKTIFDPEIPINLYDLGLIYDVKVANGGIVDIVMTLTTPQCPVAETFPSEVKRKVENIKEVTKVNLELTFNPPWNKDMMSCEAKLMLDIK